MTSIWKTSASKLMVSSILAMQGTRVSFLSSATGCVGDEKRRKLLPMNERAVLWNAQAGAAHLNRQGTCWPCIHAQAFACNRSWMLYYVTTAEMH